MSPAQPVGDPAPADGLLPASVLPGLADRTFSLYVHVPYCTVRCGYCDFNTYATEDFGSGVGRRTYALDAVQEIEQSARILAASGLAPRPLHSVFFGGGTPTRLPAEDLALILATARRVHGIVEGAEITTEANPDSVTREDLEVLRDAGFTRVSFGMQSVVPRVLAVLDRSHTPANVPQAVGWAKELGLQTSVDLISGAPGETLEEYEQSVRAAVSYAPDHISSYSLIVEPGTRLAAQIRRGELELVDDDLQADMYLLGDRLLAEAGYQWYEVSNWSRDQTTRSRHNLAYWRNQDWWGIGPGAHSHLNGVRWWNLKHPLAHAQRIRQGLSPAAGREHLSAGTRRMEEIMLAVRVREGLATDRLDAQGRASLPFLVHQGMVDPSALAEGRVVLTLKGRLLGDAVVRELTAGL